MATYLVTGGAGFIGSAIASKLLQLNNSVYIIDNLSTGYLENIPENATFIKGDFSKDDVLNKLTQTKFDAIFHIGGQSSGEISFEDPEYDLNTNTLSTLKLLEYAVSTQCNKFIYASTMSVYGEQGNKKQFSENDQSYPKSFYAVGKLASEKYLDVFSKQYGIEYTALRYFNVYGPGQNLENMKQGMVSIYLKQFLDTNYEKVEVKGALDRFRDQIFINDVVKITINALVNKKMRNQIINVGTGKITTVKDVLDQLQEKLNSSKEIIELEGTQGDQHGIYSNNEKLRSMMNIEFTPFSKGLDMMLESVKGVIDA